MKEYTRPEIEMIKTLKTDIITSSPGTELPPMEEGDGIWDLDLDL